MIEREIAGPAATQDDARLVIEQWSFPLDTLDLSLIEVTQEELGIERDRWSPE